MTQKNPKRIALIFGTRPEAIKMAPVIKALKNRSQDFEPILIATAQHRQLLDQVLDVFELTPDIDLDLMQDNQSLAGFSSRAIQALGDCLHSTKPDAVLVQGDTTTAFIGALAAFYEHIPVGHVEAGLRTYNFEAPWPEEMNRRLIAPMARWCFAPMPSARQNLLAEHIPDARIFVTGNTVIDALLITAGHVEKHPPQIPGLKDDVLQHPKMILVTGHRRESFGEPFENICKALREIAETHSDVAIIYPLHLNPNVKDVAQTILAGHPRIHLLEPLAYGPFVRLLKDCRFLITDSGGLQEEAPALGKPVLVTRETTERPEAVEAGNSILTGSDREKIVSCASRLLEDEAEYQKMAQAGSPFGDGKAAERIVDILHLKWDV